MKTKQIKKEKEKEQVVVVKEELSDCYAKQCEFHKKGCKPCSECHAEPNKINDRCNRCFDCEQREGKLRWNITLGEIEEAKNKARAEYLQRAIDDTEKMKSNPMVRQLNEALKNAQRELIEKAKNTKDERKTTIEDDEHDIKEMKSYSYDVGYIL